MFKYILIVIIILPSLVNAQTWHIKRDIEWNQEISSSTENPKDFFSFRFMNNSVYEELLPVWNDLIPWTDLNAKPTVSFYSTTFEELPPLQDLSEFISEFEKDIPIKYQLLNAAKKPYLQIELKPFRINPENGKPERLTSFVLKIEQDPYTPILEEKSDKKSSYVTSSLLKTGNWFKISVSETGIHKLTFEQLSSLGLSDPGSVRVYGWGGAMLPEDVNAGEQDDLQPTQIYINKGTDNVFGAGDYILFFAQGPVTWKYDSQNGMYSHHTNPWATRGYYFLTSGSTVDLPANAVTPEGIADYSTEYYDFLAFHEQDIDINEGIKSGRDLYGEDFITTTQRTFDFIVPGLKTDEDVILLSNLIARSKANSSYTISANNYIIDTANIQKVNTGNYTAVFAYTDRPRSLFKSNTENIQIKYKFNKPESAAKGWLDYITLNARAKLELKSGALFFRDSRGNGMLTEFRIANISANTQIWDISNIHNIKKINPVLNGSIGSFKSDLDLTSEFVAFNPADNFPAPKIDGEGHGAVENQDLHGSGFPDMIIVVYPDFISSAEKLAEYRREKSGLDVLVTTPDKIYNEFSSGRPDVTAIRNFMRYLYVNAGDDSEKLPRYLLLFGDGSYLNKTESPNKKSLIPTYQSLESFYPIDSYVSDDYFVILDAGETMLTGLLDMSVGRLPVFTPGQAELMVEKIITYEKPDRMGEWRNSICFIGDDEDGNLHMNQANTLADYVEGNYPFFNINKIFLDAFKQISTPVGQRYPDVNTSINNQIAKGALIINYTGHGGPQGLAHEKILEMNDITTWKNWDKLPLFMTATCEFSRFDDPGIVSAGEEVILNSNGGGIALLTTTRLVYAAPNYTMNERFYEVVFEKDEQNNHLSLGDILVYSKNNTGSGVNKRNFSLLGDPAMKLSYPYHNIKTDSINNFAIGEISDTIRALQKVSVSGHIADFDGSLLNSFNGLIYPVVFDKSNTQVTLGNDGGSVINFKIRNSIIYKGAAEVKDGRFSFNFIVPKDIRYSFGNGKISYYAKDSLIDAAGANYDFVIGGSSSNAPDDFSGPDLDIFMNNIHFKPGGITDNNPVLLVKLFDEHGINTTGSGIGHDLTATLNDNNQNVFILNDYYSSDPGSFQSGFIEYPFFNLEEGRHEIKVKVWDVYNNSSEALTNFVVVSKEEMILDNIMNYPNPFSDYTEFSFEHNRPNVDLDITVDIYDLEGSLVKTIKAKQFESGYRSEPLIWNGTSDSGNVKQGVYIYRIKVKTSTGQEATESGKLIMLR